MLLCAGLLDATLGGLSEFVFFSQRTGKWFRMHRTMASASQDLFVFGSSHAASHYVPEVLESELGLSSYNAGVLGQQILFHKTLEAIVLERTRPRVIVLDVDPSTLYEDQEAYDRLADLKPFYRRHPDIIGTVLSLRSPAERFYLTSKLYQFNSTFVHVARYWLAPQPDWEGYRPEYSAMQPPTPEQERRDVANRIAFRAGRALDPVMVDALARFSADAVQRNLQVFYFVSPGALAYDLDGNASYRDVKAIAARCGVPLFNFRNHPEFLRRWELFADAGHLNDLGARRYSKLVAESIRGHLVASTPSSETQVPAGSTPHR